MHERMNILQNEGFNKRTRATTTKKYEKRMDKQTKDRMKIQTKK